MLPVSVLDVAPVFAGESATASLRQAVAVAPRAEELGYVRYWAAEHHNTPCLAAASPAVLAGALAGVTTILRVGSGGVLLPNHAPLVVAEQFGTLEALHPRRIDLGIGRAPGTDPATAEALRGRAIGDDDDFPKQVSDLLSYFTPNDTSSPLVAVPAAANRPCVWMLGSSPSSARLAGALGLPYAYAHHINPSATVDALDTYRQTFRASAHQDRPYVLVASVAVLADSDTEAQRVARPYLVGKLLMRGARRFDAFPNSQQAASYAYSRADRRYLDELVAPQLLGGPATVRQKLSELVARTGADEIMALTIVPELDHRLRSLELLAQAAAQCPTVPRRAREAVAGQSERPS